MAISDYVEFLRTEFELNNIDWVNPCEDIDPQIYTLESVIHKNHSVLLADGNVCTFFVQSYSKTMIVAMYISLDNLIDFLTDDKYWLGKPNVQQMVPNSNVGLFQVSGEYLTAPEKEEDNKIV